MQEDEGRGEIIMRVTAGGRKQLNTSPGLPTHSAGGMRMTHPTLAPIAVFESICDWMRGQLLPAPHPQDTVH